MKIWQSPYQLYTKANSGGGVRTKYRSGALLRVRFDDGLVGHSDLCPFLDYGDRPLEYQFRNLQIGTRTNLLEQSLHYARIDAEFRSKGKSVFGKINSIKNNFLIADIINFDTSRLEILRASGYEELKIKMGRQFPEETAALLALTKNLPQGMLLRLDFNERVSAQDISFWLEKNNKWLRPHLEFIEDPCEYSAEVWSSIQNRFGVSLALDMAADPISTKAVGAKYVILKPAIQNVDAVVAALAQSHHKFVVTHYMDFPLGQMTALYEAILLSDRLPERMASCGLQASELFEGFSFQQQIKCDGPVVIPATGTGFGFDSWLADIEWSELKV